jgi:hypothetical protein
MLGKIPLMLSYALALDYYQTLLVILPFASVGNYAQSLLASSIFYRLTRITKGGKLSAGKLSD